MADELLEENPEQIPFPEQCFQAYDRCKNETDKAAAFNSLCELIALEENPFNIDNYVDSVASIFNKKKTIVQKYVDKIKKQNEAKAPEMGAGGLVYEFPVGVDEHQAWRKGFFALLDGMKTGYYFQTKNDWFSPQSNFIIKPLYHIFSEIPEDNRRMIKVYNGIYERVVEMQSKQMMSIEGFCGTLYGQGNFLPKEGFGKPQLLKILAEIGEDFPMIWEMKKLGWQSEGVFAFFNKTYIPPTKIGEKGTLSDYDEYGVTTEKFGDKHLFSPAIGKGQELVRQGDDVYENDRYLEYKVSPVTLQEWATLFIQVYGDKGRISIAFMVATIMRDVVLKHNKIPHLYFYGPTGSGKSEIGESINNFFYSGKDEKGDLYRPMNLNQGTDFAFFNRYETNVNTPNVLNEFDENSIPEEWFMAIKSSYDGEGRAKGSGIKGRIKEQKIVRTTILLGQYLGTKDDNSVINRSIPEAVQRVDNRTEESVNNFTRLKKLEKEGVSSLLCELMNLRPVFIKEYGIKFFENQKKFQDKAIANGLQIQSRILKNIACIYTSLELANQLSIFNYQLSIQEWFDQCYSKMRDLTLMVVRTSKISEFWKSLEYMLDRGFIRERLEFKVEDELEFLALKGEEKITHKWDNARKILYLRLTTVYKLIEEKSTPESRRNMMNEESFLLYAKEQSWYYGCIAGKRFDKEGGGSFTTTCYAFDYESLKINLLRNEAPVKKTVRLMGRVTKNAEGAPGNDKAITFNLLVTNTEQGEEGVPVTYETSYKCYSYDTAAALQILMGFDITVIGYETVQTKFGKPFYQIDIIKWVLGLDRNFEEIPALENANIKNIFEQTKKQEDLPF